MVAPLDMHSATVNMCTERHLCPGTVLARQAGLLARTATEHGRREGLVAHLVKARQEQGHKVRVRCGYRDSHLRQGERKCVQPQHLHTHY